jgi:pilus assembly protein CpaB
MKRRRGWIVLSIGFLLAIGTGFMVFFVLQQQQQVMSDRVLEMAAVAPEPAVATMTLPVAARPLQPGTILTAEDFLLKEFPLDLVPVAAITETITLESQVLVEPIGQGETFSTNKLAGEQAARVSQQIEQGKVIFAFPIVDMLGETNIIEDGDHLDLLLTLPIASPDGGVVDTVTSFTLQNIEIFRVLRPVVEDAAEARPISLLMIVSPEDAVLLKHVKDSGGVMDFVLRSQLDTEEVQVPPVGRTDLITRYNMR